MSDEIQNTSELPPVEAITETPIESTPEQPITFIIFETLVHGDLVFHPGQERKLLDANLSPVTIAEFLLAGALRGRYPKFESFEKSRGPVSHKIGK